MRRTPVEYAERWDRLRAVCVCWRSAPAQRSSEQVFLCLPGCVHGV